MAPKKQHKGQRKEGKGKSGGAKSAPQVHLSAENERRLRRLLQNNTGRSSSVPWSSGANEGTEAQRTKRLRNIYDKLACEGFISEQIERALSALSGREEITLEAALDWLCLNVPGNELPLQFSSGVSVIEHEDAEKSINVISAARADWISPKTESEEVRERPYSAIAVKIKATPKEEPQTLLQAEEADWIRHYMNQQEEMMLYGTIFGCLDPILTIAACLSHKSPFVSPKDEKNNAERAKLSLSSEGGSRQNIASGQQSDHLLLVAAYDRWVKILRQRGATAAREFCKSYFLNSPALYMIRDMRIQFCSLLADIGFIKFPKVESRKREEIDKWLNDLSQPFNIHSQHASIVKSTLCAGLYPNVAAMEEESIKAGHAGGLTYRAGLAPASRPRWYDRQREVFVHPTSINSTASEFHHPFMVFLEKVETSKVFLRDTTVISPYALLLFGGSINIQHQTGSVTVDGWLKMNATAQTAVIFKELRLALHSILQELIQKPKERGAAAEREIVHSIVQLLIDEEKPQH